MAQALRREVEAESKNYLPQELAHLVSQYHDTFGHQIAVHALDLLPNYSIRGVDFGAIKYPSMEVTYYDAVMDVRGGITVLRMGENVWQIKDFLIGGGVSTIMGDKNAAIERILRYSQITYVDMNNLLGGRRGRNVVLYDNDPNDPYYDVWRV